MKTQQILDLGNSSNLEQILHINVDNPKTRPVIVTDIHRKEHTRI